MKWHRGPTIHRPRRWRRVYSCDVAMLASSIENLSSVLSILRCMNVDHVHERRNARDCNRVQRFQRISNDAALSWWMTRAMQYLTRSRHLQNKSIRPDRILQLFSVVYLELFHITEDLYQWTVATHHNLSTDRHWCIDWCWSRVDCRWAMDRPSEEGHTVPWSDRISTNRWE